MASVFAPTIPSGSARVDLLVALVQAAGGGVGEAILRPGRAVVGVSLAARADAPRGRFVVEEDEAGARLVLVADVRGGDRAALRQALDPLLDVPGQRVAARVVGGMLVVAVTGGDPLARAQAPLLVTGLLEAWRALLPPSRRPVDEPLAPGLPPDDVFDA